MPCSTASAKTVKVWPTPSSWATSASATVAPLTADRNSWLRPLASTMVEDRWACSV